MNSIPCSCHLQARFSTFLHSFHITYIHVFCSCEHKKGGVTPHPSLPPYRYPPGGLSSPFIPHLFVTQSSGFIHIYRDPQPALVGTAICSNLIARSDSISNVGFARGSFAFPYFVRRHLNCRRQVFLLLKFSRPPVCRFSWMSRFVFFVLVQMALFPSLAIYAYCKNKNQRYWLLYYSTSTALNLGIYLCSPTHLSVCFFYFCRPLLL
jgi:hypothetical protein